MTTPCATCKAWLGLTRTHGSDCPVRASAWCSQCGCYGHRPSECDTQLMWTRPASLEELIPRDVRERWDITTNTPIAWISATLEDAEREIAENNTIEIRYVDKLDSRLREFMKANKVRTVHKMEGNLQILREWAVSNGKKIRLVQES